MGSTEASSVVAARVRRFSAARIDFHGGSKTVHGAAS